MKKIIFIIVALVVTTTTIALNAEEPIKQPPVDSTKTEVDSSVDVISSSTNTDGTTTEQLVDFEDPSTYQEMVVVEVNGQSIPVYEVSDGQYMYTFEESTPENDAEIMDAINDATKEMAKE